MIVEDQFTISKEEAQQLVTSFQQMQQSLRVTEEEVRRGERLLASVVQSVDDCIFTADIDGRLVTMNPAGRRLTGHAEVEVGRLGFRDLLAVPDPREARTIDAAVESGRGWRGQVTGGGSAASGSRPTSPSRASSTPADLGWARSACCAISPSRWRRSGG